jgi:hypothetical protein
MSDAHNHSGHDSHGGGHEKSDLALGAMLWIIPASLTLLLVFVTVITFLTAGAASREMTAKQYGGADAGKGQIQALRAHEDSILTANGTDSTGTPRMPVSRAMEIIAERK